MSIEKWGNENEIEQEENVHVMDAGRVIGDLHIRPWKEGDRMRPLGMKGHKKLSDIFVDERFDRFAKRRALVFEDEEGIVLLDGFRIADRSKLHIATREIIRVEIRMKQETE